MSFLTDLLSIKHLKNDNYTAGNKPLISNGGGFGQFSITARWNAKHTNKPNSTQSATAHSGEPLATRRRKTRHRDNDNRKEWFENENGRQKI